MLIVTSHYSLNHEINNLPFSKQHKAKYKYIWKRGETSWVDVIAWDNILRQLRIEIRDTYVLIDPLMRL